MNALFAWITCTKAKNINSLYKTFAPNIKYALPVSSLKRYAPIRKNMINKKDKAKGGLKESNKYFFPQKHTKNNKYIGHK